MITRLGDSIFISRGLSLTGDLSVGHGTVIGKLQDEKSPVQIEGDALVGRFCIIESDVVIGANFYMDDYCAVYAGSKVGRNVKLLYGKRIYGRSVVGDDCIIGGNVPERCILAERVTFMGEVAHSHYDPTRDWDTTDEPSPTVGRGSIIGVNAIIVGGVSVGENCYVSAGEILRHDLKDNMVFIKNQILPISHFRGLIRTRF